MNIWAQVVADSASDLVVSRAGQQTLVWHYLRVYMEKAMIAHFQGGMIIVVHICVRAAMAAAIKLIKDDSTSQVEHYE